MTRALRILAVGVLAFAVGAGASAGAREPTHATPIYSAGDRVDDLPLRAVLERDDTAQYVAFIYGDCEAGDDAACAPPAEIQVWPACHRNLGLYEKSLASGGEVERVTIRGVPGALFDDGTRLELETGATTVVVFARTRVQVLRVAAALRSLDGSLPPGGPLPAPERGREEGAVAC